MSIYSLPGIETSRHAGPNNEPADYAAGWRIITPPGNVPKGPFWRVFGSKQFASVVLEAEPLDPAPQVLNLKFNREGKLRIAGPQRLGELAVGLNEMVEVFGKNHGLAANGSTNEPSINIGYTDGYGVPSVVVDVNGYELGARTNLWVDGRLSCEDTNPRVHKGVIAATGQTGHGGLAPHVVSDSERGVAAVFNAPGGGESAQTAAAELRAKLSREVCGRFFCEVDGSNLAGDWAYQQLMNAGQLAAEGAVARIVSDGDGRRLGVVAASGETGAYVIRQNGSYEQTGLGPLELGPGDAILLATQAMAAKLNAGRSLYGITSAGWNSPEELVDRILKTAGNDGNNHSVAVLENKI